MTRSDPWHCGGCDAAADLSLRAAEVALVRLAANGSAGFRLGSAGVESSVGELLEPCPCGGRLEPGRGAGVPIRATFAPAPLRAVASRGWPLLAESGERDLVALREIWQPRILMLLGREHELEREQVLQVRLEAKLEALAHEIERATAGGDGDAAEAAHARYIELGTTYVRRFVAGDERSPVG